MYLPDINVWLALAFGAHVHHRPARSWFEALPENERCFFCRFTQQGFLRLANNAKAFPEIAVNQAEAWAMFDAFIADPRVEVAPEPPTLEVLWRQYTQHPHFSPQAWGDAYLAAFAQTADFEIVTFDKGFAQYPGLRHTILS